MNKKLQILIPHYKEPFEVIKPLLDSINIQQNVDLKNEVGVIIVNDGDECVLDKKLFENYTYEIEYYVNKHSGVSATRNACLDKATADYVMFCDCDDMFCNVCGLWIIFREMISGFDGLVSVFMEENRMPNTKEVFYLNRGDMNNGGVDITFVHGKVYRRQYLLDNDIRWNDKLTIHEDSYFNCLCQTLSQNIKYCPTPFYLWKWRDESVCRHDEKYILKTYNNMLDSNTELVLQLIKRGKTNDAQIRAVSMIYDAYFTMNKQEWINQENKQYRHKTELRFKQYYKQFSYLLDAIDERVKAQIIMGIKNRFFQEGLVLESITFDQWIKHISRLKN